MATIKSYTDIEQSKKLAEILPLDSADMCYIQDLLANCKYGDYKPYIGDLIPAYGQDKIRCWSLSALLGVLPNPNLFEADGLWHIFCDNNLSCINGFDNPVDACVAMIIRLNELNLLWL